MDLPHNYYYPAEPSSNCLTVLLLVHDDLGNSSCKAQTSQYFHILSFDVLY